MCVPGRGVRPGPCSLVVDVGTGEAGVEQRGLESGCALSLAHPSNMAAAACSAPGGETEAHHQIRVHTEGRASGRVQQPRGWQFYWGHLSESIMDHDQRRQKVIH